MATIKDIANRLGVSISTVSKGLNGASDISDELRQTVLDTAVEMGYSTKRSRKEENRKLCVFVENMNYDATDEFGYNVVLGFRQNAFRYHWNVDVLPITPAFQEENKYDTFLLKEGYSGAFLMGFTLRDAWMTSLQTSIMPTVLLDNFIANNPNVCYVGTDSFEGIHMAVRHLFSLGHKNIGFLNGPLYSKVSDDRQNAFESSMRSFNLPVTEVSSAHSYYSPEAAKHHVSNFLANGITAIICGSDLIAKGVIEECQRQNYRVPEDISVVGFDDAPIATTFTPPLTTIRQEHNELGRCAYVSLSSLINHIPISKMLMRPKLIERSSTAFCNGTVKKKDVT